MTTSILIAKALAVVYISVGLGIFLNPTYFRSIIDDFIGSPAATFVGSLMALLIGILMIAFHNIWLKDWTVIITIFGWLALVKGLLGVIFPEQFVSLSNRLVQGKTLQVSGIIVILLGVFFVYFGFLA